MAVNRPTCVTCEAPGPYAFMPLMPLWHHFSTYLESPTYDALVEYVTYCPPMDQAAGPCNHQVVQNTPRRCAVRLRSARRCHLEDSHVIAEPPHSHSHYLWAPGHVRRYFRRPLHNRGGHRYR